MNRKLILLTLVLLALAGWLSWMLRVKWIELHKHERTVIASPTKVGPQFSPSPTPMIQRIAATDYIAIPQNAILFKDRNSNVILDPPPPPPPPPAPIPMPELPAYFGSMSIGDPVAMLKLPKGAQKSYHAGEKVGPFLLVSFNRDKVVFDWDGKTVERKPEELKEKESTPEETQPRPPPPVAQMNGGNSNVKSISGANAEPKVSEKLGADNGGGVRQCVRGDTTPVGTIVDGYKKVVTTNMFGETCMWQKVNP